MSSHDFLNYTLSIILIVLVVFLLFTTIQTIMVFRMISPVIKEAKSFKNLWRDTIYVTLGLLTLPISVIQIIIKQIQGRNGQFGRSRQIKT